MYVCIYHTRGGSLSNNGHQPGERKSRKLHPLQLSLQLSLQLTLQLIHLLQLINPPATHPATHSTSATHSPPQLIHPLQLSLA
jgi:hypothetical protein